MLDTVFMMFMKVKWVSKHTRIPGLPYERQGLKAKTEVITLQEHQNIKTNIAEELQRHPDYTRIKYFSAAVVMTQITKDFKHF